MTINITRPHATNAIVYVSICNYFDSFVYEKIFLTEKLPNLTEMTNDYDILLV